MLIYYENVFDGGRHVTALDESGLFVKFEMKNTQLEIFSELHKALASVESICFYVISISMLWRNSAVKKPTKLGNTLTDYPFPHSYESVFSYNSNKLLTSQLKMGNKRLFVP